MPSRRPAGSGGVGEVGLLPFFRNFRGLPDDRGEETRAGGVTEAFCVGSGTGAGGEGMGAGPPLTPLMDGLGSTKEKKSKVPVNECAIKNFQD